MVINSWHTNDDYSVDWRNGSCSISIPNAILKTYTHYSTNNSTWIGTETLDPNGYTSFGPYIGNTTQNGARGYSYIYLKNE